MKKSVAELKNLIASFDDAAFGEPIPSPAPVHMPKCTPPKGKHPRMGFTAERLSKIMEGVETGDGKYAYAEILRLSDMDCDGVMRDFSNHDLTNNARIINCEVHNIILCKAFRYAATKDQQYGYEAIYALKNYLTTCFIHMDEAFGCEIRKHYWYNVSLTMAEAMSVIGCVYDWCYDLLTDRDKKQLVGAAMEKCRPRLEFPEYPPQRSGGVAGHQSGPVFMTGWIPFVLAVYDEYPEYYNVIFDVVENIIVPGQNHLLRAGFHGQGIAYGASRLACLMKAECWWSYMFDNQRHLFTDKIEEACLTFLKAIRPDGETLRIGDDFFQGRRFCHVIMCALFGTGLYKNPILKGFTAHQTDDFSMFWLHGMNPLDVLLFNDAKVEKKALDALPLVSFYGDPAGIILAKTAHNDKNAGMVYMKIGTQSTSNHEHKDCGDFQIYHKGMLLGSSGCYADYGSEHDSVYYKQTISKNSILVFNPNMQDNGEWVYSGGQRIDGDAGEHVINDLEDWKTNSHYDHAKLLYGGYKTTIGADGKEEYCYSYIAGDLTKAYNAETVTEVKRHMVSLATGNKTNPMVFVIFDKITAVDEHYKKTLLFHTQNTPLCTFVDGKPCTVVTNLMSKLFIQSLGCQVEHSFVGGMGKEFMVNGKNISCFFEGRAEGMNSVYNTESGLGRIEVTPKQPAKTDSFLTVMYVGPHTDCSPFLGLDTNILQPYQKAIELSGEKTMGAAILGHALLFAKNGEYITEDFASELAPDTKKCLVFGLKAGKWRDEQGNEYLVTAQEAMAEVPVQGNSNLKMQYIG